MYSPTFKLLARAILERQQVTFVYEGYDREACPHILGHKGSREAKFAFQFDGSSSRGLPPRGEWRCFYVDRMTEVCTRFCGAAFHAARRPGHARRVAKEFFQHRLTSILDRSIS